MLFAFDWYIRDMSDVSRNNVIIFFICVHTPLSLYFVLYVCVRARARVCACVCVRVCLFISNIITYTHVQEKYTRYWNSSSNENRQLKVSLELKQTHTRKYKHTHKHAYIYTCTPTHPRVPTHICAHQQSFVTQSAWYTCMSYQ